MDADMGPADTEKLGQRSEEHTGECWGAGNGGPCSRFYQAQVTESRPSWTGPHRRGPIQRVGRRAGTCVATQTLENPWTWGRGAAQPETVVELEIELGRG